MSILKSGALARLTKIEAAPRVNRPVDQVAAARARLARFGIAHEHAPLTAEESRQLKGRGLADKLHFFRLRRMRIKAASS
jgi:hypothetical protein